MEEKITSNAAVVMFVGSSEDWMNASIAYQHFINTIIGIDLIIIIITVIMSKVLPKESTDAPYGSNDELLHLPSLFQLHLYLISIDGTVSGEASTHFRNRIGELQSIVLKNLEFDGGRESSATAVDPVLACKTCIIKEVPSLESTSITSEIRSPAQ
ncbi:hypothetical protein AgCh_001419 [Apium graveolens]